MVGKLITILLIAGSAAWAQHISVGLVGGVPFTGGLDDFTTPTNVVNQVTHTFSDSKEYIVGPMLEVRLPFSLAIEADALYRPVNVTSDVVLSTGASQVTFQSSTNASTWEFPILGKYRFAFPIVHPFIEAGPSFRAKGNTVSYFSGKGFILGGGVEVKILKLRIAPAIRYTHWGSDAVAVGPSPGAGAASFPPSKQNQAEFLVGFSF